MFDKVFIVIVSIISSVGSDYVQVRIANYPNQIIGSMYGPDIRVINKQNIEFCSLVLTGRDGLQSWITKKGACSSFMDLITYGVMNNVIISKIAYWHDQSASPIAQNGKYIDYDPVKNLYVCSTFTISSGQITVMYGKGSQESGYAYMNCPESVDQSEGYGQFMLLTTASVQ
eukprot:TRINITY_DN5465_c0_g3_i1.p1 TRINITY_DN5465_c0_g3~~TRINITY_DN5465_c0_g3_i1.p1  ORF type:complete len:197 (-),score=-2.73 TRINITY_DN5465_c0_g3_i1:385-900(-)